MPDSPTILTARSSAGERPVYIGRGMLDELGGVVSELAPGELAFVVSDWNVYAKYGERIEAALRGAGYRVENFVFPAGEASKQAATLDAIYLALLAVGANRSTPLIALGGGVCGDMAGFAAATFMRGIPLFQAPTSLVAQVDASLGGKVGIDHTAGKNLIGTFYPAEAVIIDPDCLKTLPGRELSCGMAEVVKYGLIGDGEVLALLRRDLAGLLSLEAGPVDEAVLLCARDKLAVVEADERDLSGVRAALNYGHTVGHALEAAAGFTGLSHGEGVAVGMVAAARLGLRSGLLSESDAALHEDLLLAAGLPVRLPEGTDIDEVIVRMRGDKKADAAGLRLVLLEGLGHPVLVRLPEEEVIAVLNELKAEV